MMDKIRWKQGVKIHTGVYFYEFVVLFLSIIHVNTYSLGLFFPCSLEMFKYAFLVQNAWHLPAAPSFVFATKEAKGVCSLFQGDSSALGFSVNMALVVSLSMASGTKPASPLLATWVQIHSLCEVGTIYGMRYFDATSQKL